MGDGVALDGGEARSCVAVCSGEGRGECAAQDELALAKLVVLDCGGVSSISVPLSGAGLGVEMAASSSGWGQHMLRRPSQSIYRVDGIWR